jgi:hypothetical protein
VWICGVARANMAQALRSRLLAAHCEDGARVLVDAPAAFYCPVTHALMKDPVMDREGHTYEREAIVQWIGIRGMSPMSTAPLAVEDLAPNRALRDAIQEEYWREPVADGEAGSRQHSPAAIVDLGAFFAQLKDFSVPTDAQASVLAAIMAGCAACAATQSACATALDAIAASTADAPFAAAHVSLLSAAMQRHAADATVQAAAVRVLVRLVLNKQVDAVLGLLPLVAVALRSHKADGVVVELCLFFAEAAASERALGDELLQFVPDTLAAMRAFALHADIQRRALAVLAAAKLADDVVVADISAHVRQAMQAHVADARVQHNGLLLLWELHKSSEARLAQFADVASAALHAHPRHGPIVGCGLNVLAAATEAAPLLDAVPIVVAVLTTHARVLPLLSACVGVLCTLLRVGGAGMKRHLVAYLPDVVNALHPCLHNYPRPSVACVTNAMEFVQGVVGALGGDPDPAPDPAPDHGLDLSALHECIRGTVRCILRAYPGDWKVLVAALNTLLASLTCYARDSEGVEGELASAVVDACAACSHVAAVQRAGMHVLRALRVPAGDPAAVSRVMYHVAQSMATHLYDADLQHAGLCVFYAAVAAYARADVLQPHAAAVVAALSAHRTLDQIAQLGTSLLAAIATDASADPAMVKHVDIITWFVSKRPTHVGTAARRQAFQCLLNLATAPANLPAIASRVRVYARAYEDVEDDPDAGNGEGDVRAAALRLLRKLAALPVVKAALVGATYTAVYGSERAAPKHARGARRGKGDSGRGTHKANERVRRTRSGSV